MVEMAKRIDTAKVKAALEKQPPPATDAARNQPQENKK